MSLSPSDKAANLYQILSGRVSNRRADYPLVEWDALFDLVHAFHENFCTTDKGVKDKSVAAFNKIYLSNVNELKSMRVTRHDFEILKTIGKGHFGEVHVVKEKNGDNVFAMKVLKKSATLSQDQAAFFFEERDIMAYAAGEWVTCLNYSFHDHENLYLVMEFLPGGDLLQLINKFDETDMDENTIQFYLSEIIIAVNCVHKIGYVHRDIKPENILLDLTGHVKLADFGSAARLINGNVASKMPVGTPEYIAPEVLTSMDRDGGRYGVECDYWSIGVVAYELFSGELPFEADSVLQLYSKIMDFKNSLVFPDDLVLSKESKSLINGLICGQKERLTYYALAKHEFFSSIDWTTIRNIRPPCVPDVKSNADTSNFDDFPTARSLVASSALNKQNVEISAFLPFIGYTFTRSLYQRLQGDVAKCNRGLNDESFTSTIKRRREMAPAEVKPDTEVIKAQLDAEKQQREEIAKKLLKVETQNKYYVEELEKQKNHAKKILEERTVKEESDASPILLNKVLGDVFKIFDLQYEAELNDPLTSLKERFAQINQNCEKLRSDNEHLKNNQKSNELKLSNVTELQEAAEERFRSTCDSLKISIETLQGFTDRVSKEASEQIVFYKNQYEEQKKKLARMKQKLDKVRTDYNAAKDREDGSNLGKDSPIIDSNEILHKNEMQRKEIENGLQAQKQLRQEISHLEDTLQQKNRQLETLNEDYVRMQQSAKEYSSQLKAAHMELAKKSGLQSELEILKEEMKSRIQNFINEKIDLETRLSKLNSNSVGSISEKEFSEKLNAAHHKIKYLEEKLRTLQEVPAVNSDVLIELKSERDIILSQLDDETQNNKKLSEEIFTLQQMMSFQKSSNYELMEKIEEYEEELAQSTLSYRDLSNKYDKLKTTQSDHVLQLNESIKQHEKLIAYLQSSCEVSGKKKKLFGKSKQTPPEINKSYRSNTGLSVKEDGSKIKALQLQLEKERKNVLNLSHELKIARDEIKQLTNKASDPRVRSSTNLLKANNRLNSVSTLVVGQGSESPKVSSTQVTGAVHSFSDTIMHKNIICAVCLTPIYIGVETAFCQECKLACHSYCEEVMPYKCRPNTNKNIPYVPSISMLQEGTLLQKSLILPALGWVNMPKNVANSNKHEWVQKWLILSNSALYIFEKEITYDSSVNYKDMEEVETYDFEIGTYVLHTTIPGSEILAMANSKILQPFWAIQLPDKVGRGSISGKNSRKMLYFSANTLEDKLYWSSLMYKVISDNCPLVYDNGYHIKMIADANGSTVGAINAVQEIEDHIFIVGTEKGLGFFNCNPNSEHDDHVTVQMLTKFSQISGITVLKEGVILIHGSDRHLLKLDKHTFEKHRSGRLNKSSIDSYLFLPKMNMCHLIKYGKIDGDKYFFVAYRTNISVLKVNSFSSFTPLHDVNMKDVVNGITITPNNLIVSTVTPYVVKIKTFESKPLMDKSDVSLAFFVFGSANNSNILMDTFVLNSKKNIEYLFCYSEAGVFINSEGRKSRSTNLTWRDVPLKFKMLKMKLYVCYLSAIGVIMIEDDPSTVMYSIAIPEVFCDSPYPLCTLENGLLLSTTDRQGDTCLMYLSKSSQKDLDKKFEKKLRNSVITGNM